MIAKVISKPNYDEQDNYHPAVVKCECGEELVLFSTWMDALQCPTCKQWYNTSGQELKDPSQWETIDDTGLM